MRPPSRITGRRLQWIRKQVLDANPLCARCTAKGLTVVATQVDHIIAIANGGIDSPTHPFLNRQGLCDACHADKTAQDMGHRHQTIGLDGWPVAR